jgi:hypothetical protein
MLPKKAFLRIHNVLFLASFAGKSRLKPRTEIQNPRLSASFFKVEEIHFYSTQKSYPRCNSPPPPAPGENHLDSPDLFVKNKYSQ